MKYCINTQMLSPQMSLEEKIVVASRSGMDGVEPWVDEIKCAKDVFKCSKDYGIEIVAVQQIKGLFENDGGIMGVANNHLDIVDECKRRMSKVVEVGCEWIILAPALSHRGFNSSWSQSLDYYFELLEIGYSMGCLPSLEFLGQTKQIYNFDLCKKFLDDVGHELGTMVVDSYHLWRGGGSMNDFEDCPKEKISMFHMSDADKAIERESHMDRNRVLPLDGKLDLSLFAAAVKKTGFDGFVNAGVYNKSLWDLNADLMVVDCLRRMKDVFQSGNV